MPPSESAINGEGRQARSPARYLAVKAPLKPVGGVSARSATEMRSGARSGLHGPFSAVRPEPVRAAPPRRNAQRGGRPPVTWSPGHVMHPETVGRAGLAGPRSRSRCAPRGRALALGADRLARPEAKTDERCQTAPASPARPGAGLMPRPGSAFPTVPCVAGGPEAPRGTCPAILARPRTE